MKIIQATKAASLALLTAGLLSGAGAQAASLESYLKAGQNVIEDDSNEYIFRPRVVDNDGQQATIYDLVISGDIAVGDVLVQLLDFPIINGVNIDSAGDELSGVALNTVQSIDNPRLLNPDGPGPIPPYNAIDITFGAASAMDWLALTGVPLGALPFDATGLVAMLFYDSVNNFDVYTDSLAQIGDILDGDLEFALGLSGGGDYIYASAVPLDIGTFAPSAGETPGVTIYGQFFYGLNVLFEGLSGEVNGGFTGSGNNLVTDRPLIAAVIDDTQASFNYVPEPGSILLLGLGLLGMGFGSRKKVK